MFKLYMRVLPCGTIEVDQAALYMRLLVVAATLCGTEQV